MSLNRSNRQQGVVLLVVLFFALLLVSSIATCRSSEPSHRPLDQSSRRLAIRESAGASGAYRMHSA